MADTTGDWSRSWKSSTDPSKQRKYRSNAPLHVKDRLVSSNLAPELREELGTRSISLRTGDRVKVTRGDDSGSDGIVSRIDRDEEKVYVNGVEQERLDGTMNPKPLEPSNLQVTALNIDDSRRLEKYDVEDVESIRVEEEEMEEALEEEDESEMMQRMQGESGEEEEETEEPGEEAGEDVSEDEAGDTESESEKPSETEDYDDIVSGTIDEAKEQLQELDNPDYQKALEAEKNNKNRTTFTDWLEGKTG